MSPEKVHRPLLLRLMEIGDVVTYQGREYALRGLDPMSVDARRAEPEDLRTGERLWVPLTDLEASFNSEAQG